MVTDEDILMFFREQLPKVTTLWLKPVLLEPDDVLQEFAEIEDLALAIDNYSTQFHLDVSALNIEDYYPWEISWFFRKWFIARPVKQSKKPLTVRMFAESAKAGRWLY